MPGRQLLINDWFWPGAARHLSRPCGRCPTHPGHSIPSSRELRTARGCRSPGLAISDVRHDRIDARRAFPFPLMMWFHRSTTGKLSPPVSFYYLARRAATKRDGPARPIAWERRSLPSAQLNQAIAR